MSLILKGVRQSSVVCADIFRASGMDVHLETILGSEYWRLGDKRCLNKTLGDAPSSEMHLVSGREMLFLKDAEDF